MTWGHRTFTYTQIHRVPDCATLCSGCTIPAPKLERNTNVLPKNALYAANPARMASEEMESYCAAHPGSPSAVRRPALSIRGELWIALLGPSIEKGIVGIGSTVEAALHAFDSKYMAGSRFAE
jgi:hypothetical protein